MIGLEHPWIGVAPMNSRIVRLLPLSLLLLLLPFAAHSATLFVSPEGSGTDGASWETSFNKIGDAILASTTGDEIWVGTGTYVENLVVTIPLTILGGFEGTESLEQRESRDPEQYPTVIDGNRKGSVLTIRRNLTMEGVTVQNGLNPDGSGIHVLESILELSDVMIKSNGESTNRGGGIFIRDGQLHVDECLISSNISKNRGGGIFAERTNIILHRSEFRDNISFELGSGVYVDTGQVEVIDSRFFRNGFRNGNKEGGRGGGVRVIYGDLSINNSSFQQNYPSGLSIGASTAEISQSVFIENVSGIRAGGFHAIAESHYTIDRCLFERNITDPGPQPIIVVTEGGAIFSQDSKGMVSNSVFIQNQSLKGSIVSLKDTEPGEVVFSNCTAEIDTEYGGTYGVGWDVSPRFVNCILTSEGAPFFFFRDTGDISYSLIQGGYPGEGNIDADPRFVDPANGDYRLQRGSPCIESGTDTGLTHDFDGNFRPVGDYDMGAFEYPFLRSDINGDGFIDALDLLIFSEDWMKVSGP